MPKIKLSRHRPKVPFEQLSIGQRVQWLLLLKQLSQTSAAQLAGITQSALANIIGEQRKPSAETLLKLAKALDTSPEFIYYGHGAPTSTASPEDDPQEELLHLFRKMHAGRRQQLLVMARILTGSSHPNQPTLFPKSE